MSEVVDDAPAGDAAPCTDREPSAWMLFRLGVRVAIVSALIGLAVGVLEPTWAAVFENVVYAVCIGLSVFVFHVFPRGTKRRKLQWTLRDHALRALLSIPLGFVVGIVLAAWLRGRPTGLAAFVNVAPFAGVVTVVSGLGFMYYFWSSRRLADQAAAQADAQRMAAEARLLLLRTQLEPHMLFNTLANLRSLIEIDASRAQAMVDELIVYLRATLSASRQPLTTLEGEFAQLRAYLELMRVRMPTRLAYTLELPDDLRATAIPPMLLQPLVENAIRHGLEPKIAGGTIRVVARRDGESLAIEVADDGVGLDSAVPTEGYGLTHVRERLATLYGDAARFTVGAGSDGGVRIAIVMPLRVDEATR